MEENVPTGEGINLDNAARASQPGCSTRHRLPTKRTRASIPGTRGRYLCPEHLISRDRQWEHRTADNHRTSVRGASSPGRSAGSRQDVAGQDGRPFSRLSYLISHRVASEPLFASLHELLGPGVVVSGVDPFPAAQIRDGRFSTEAFQYYLNLLFGCVLAEGRSADALNEGLHLTSPFSHLFGSVSGIVFGKPDAPSSGIYPRELIPARLSLISGLKYVPFC